ncbi:hypothetical protein [Treponema sp.]|uniref:hypothetical protein n=1 Tax=Treponema sp. TaxID=166 RepID=UPI0025FD4CDD|nr:hypothetical protein [Treponema sp.]MCR5217305.1 hypothetical protein [Treponema sp.]
MTYKGFVGVVELLAMIFTTFVLAFASVVPNSEEIIEKFWKQGNYIKVIKDSNNICYYYKNSVTGINVDEDDYEIASMEYNVWTSKNGDFTSYNIKKWNINSDDDGNIIITRK